MLTGPDVSEHQGNVDWDKVAGAKNNLGLVRVADGDHRDPWYSEERVRAVRAAGLLLGPYYFARVASPQNLERDGSAEAKMAIGFAKSRGWSWPGDLPLIYDFETNNAQPNDKCARHLIQFIKAYRSSEDHYPGIYTMPGFWAQILPNLSKPDQQLVARCFLHQAEWGVSQPSSLQPWNGPTLWQFTDHGTCSGVSGNVDLNRSVVAEKAVLALAKQSGRPVPHDPVTELPKPEKPKPEPDHPEAVPSWVPRQYWELWQKPWEPAAASSSKFRELCWKNGFASPHFEAKETSCHDPANTAVPTSLRANAQRQAFNLEKFRHAMGDKPLPILSWYRTPAWNTAVGGASQSRHMQADATDFTIQTVQSFGSTKFDETADKLYANGGFGTYPSGSRHTDSRGTKARWSSF
jgi:GH25 family lysozyme M1 (1,4-beta-N-acetylmuramidase)